MLWGCFAASDQRILVWLHGIMKKENYVDIWRDNMRKFNLSLGLGHRWVFPSTTVLKGHQNQGLGVACTQPRSQSY